MKTFIQLKDNIGWAHITTNSDVDGIEVPLGSGDFYLYKIYENDAWSSVTLNKFAIINDDGTIKEIRETYFPSEILGPIWTIDVSPGSKWIENAWVVPAEIAPE